MHEMAVAVAHNRSGRDGVKANGIFPLQPYYQNRANLPSNPPRVQPSNTPRPVAPTHVYQTSSQVMMIPQQPLQFPNSQGPAYFIPSGQVRLGTSFAFPYLPMYCKIYSLMIMTRFCPRIYCNMYGISIEEHLPFCVCVFLPLSLSPPCTLFSAVSSTIHASSATVPSGQWNCWVLLWDKSRIRFIW